MPLPMYLGAIAVITLALTAILLTRAHRDGVADHVLVILGIVLLVATNQLAVATMNWLATLVVTPRPLPRMDFFRGIPAQSRTLVVVPTMLTSAGNIERLAEALEVRFLANRDEHLHFGLLTDFSDASAETLPEDVSLLWLARKAIEELNEKYRQATNPAGDGAIVDAFFLFHRPRRWNPQERIWMGYERKRGKLADLNAFLRGDREGRFSLVVGDTSVLSHVKYVIALDTDTQLPRDSARQFVAAMAQSASMCRAPPSGTSTLTRSGADRRFDVRERPRDVVGRLRRQAELSSDLCQGKDAAYDARRRRRLAFGHERVLAPGKAQARDDIADARAHHLVQIHRFERFGGRHDVAHQHLVVAYGAMLCDQDRPFAENVGRRDEADDDVLAFDDEQRAHALGNHRLPRRVDRRLRARRHRGSAAQVGHHVGCRRIGLNAQHALLHLQPIRPARHRPRLMQRRVRSSRGPGRTYDGNLGGATESGKHPLD
ncbi:MAG TPA: hypothetical protein VN085_09450, partial [Vicinamibacterales bacterium]|nr:hypothetical protein [Vicinamibacterales bacterium]